MRLLLDAHLLEHAVGLEVTGRPLLDLVGDLKLERLLAR